MARDLMTVRLDQIPEGGLDVTFGMSDPRFVELLAEFGQGQGARTGSGTVNLELWPRRVDVNGTVSVDLPQLCVRCLEPFADHLEHRFEQFLMRSGTEEPDEAPEVEIELSLRDLDRSMLVGDKVDLAELLREELMLSMPSKPVCKEDCKGICAGCGAELNTEPCTCGPKIDPRWDALKGLKFD